MFKNLIIRVFFKIKHFKLKIMMDIFKTQIFSYVKPKYVKIGPKLSYGS